MWALLIKILGLRKSIGLGLAVAAFLVAASPYLPARLGDAGKAATPEAQAEVSGASAIEETAAEGDVAPAANPLDKLNVLNFKEDGFDWRSDWWKYLALCLGSLMILYFGLRVAKMVVRFAVFALCVCAGVVGSLVLEPVLSPWIGPRLPDSITQVITSRHAGYAIGFLLCYLLATIVMSMFRKPLNENTKENKL